MILVSKLRPVDLSSLYYLGTLGTDFLENNVLQLLCSTAVKTWLFVEMLLLSYSAVVALQWPTNQNVLNFEEVDVKAVKNMHIFSQPGKEKDIS